MKQEGLWRSAFHGESGSVFVRAKQSILQKTFLTAEDMYILKKKLHNNYCVYRFLFHFFIRQTLKTNI